GVQTCALPIFAQEETAYRAPRPLADWSPSPARAVEVYWHAPGPAWTFAQSIEAMGGARVHALDADAAASRTWNAGDVLLLSGTGAAELESLRTSLPADGPGIVLTVFGAGLPPGLEAWLATLESLEPDAVTRGVGGLYPGAADAGLAGVRLYADGARRVAVIEHAGREPLSQIALPPGMPPTPGRQSVFE